MIKTIITAALDWLLALGMKIFSAFRAKKQDESKNSENRDNLEKAETDEEFQQSADDLAGRLGHRNQ